MQLECGKLTQVQPICVIARPLIFCHTAGDV
jgi:hypothetical protein